MLSRDGLLQKKREIEEIKELLEKRKVQEGDVEKVTELNIHRGKSLRRALKDPKVRMRDLIALEKGLAAKNRDRLYQSELDIKYAGYIKRQERQVERFRRMENMRLPADLEYSRVIGLSTEAVEKLNKVKPLSMGQAGRISGVRSSDIAVLMVNLTKND